MEQIYILNNNDKLVAVLSEETGLIETKLKEELNRGSSFLFTIDATVDGAEHVKAENQVVFKDRDGDLRLFVIKETDDINTVDGAITDVTCEPAFMELKDKVVVDRRINDGTAQTALNRALEDTRWTGTVEIELDTASTNFYYMSSIDAIWQIMDVWGGEFKDVVEFDGNQITARKIILKQRLGADKGARFEIDNNIKEIQRTVLSYPVTALYGRGASLEIEDDEGNATGGHTRYIDFADVEWKVSKGDPVDKPLGQKWVGDPQALNRYGLIHNGKLLHREGEFSNQDYETAEELLWATWQALQVQQHPEVNYRLSVDTDNLDVSLGDGAVAIDREFARPIEIQTRIISIEYDLLDIEGTTVIEMGQFIDLDIDIDRELEDIKEQLTKPRPTKPIDNTSYPDIKPSTPTLSATGLFESIMLEWEYDSAIYIGAYEVYGSQTKDFVPQSQHLLWRGKTSAFTHKIKADQTWYYRIRAVNTRGTASEYSNQATASTVRIMTDDILFGAITAEKLADMSVTAEKLSQGVSEDLENAKQSAQDAIEKANESVETSNTAITKAEESFTKAQDALTSASGADSKADQALNKAQEGFDKAQESFDKIDNLTIGARNYLANKNIVENSGIVNYVALVDELVSGKVKSVTLSTHGYSYGYDNRINLVFVYDNYITDPNDPTAFEFIENPTLPYTHTVEGKGILYVYVGNFNSDLTSSVFPLTRKQLIDAKFKLETGTVPTDWTEAPEDTDQKISVIADDLDGLSVEVSNNKGEIASVKQTAQGLQTSVENAEGNISDLIQTADGLQTRVQNAEGEISTVKQTAQGLQSRVETVENWETGTTNLILGTSSSFKTANWTSWNVTPSPVRFQAEVGQEYTARVYYRNVTGINVGLRMFWYNSAGSLIVESPNSNSIAIGSEGYAELTDKAPVGAVEGNIVLRRTSQSGTGSAQYKELILVKGNKIGSWQPAPEDTDQKFSSITQTVNGIQTEVGKKVDNTTYSSKMTQLDNAIAARITTTDANNKFATQSQLTLTENSFSTRVEKIENWDLGTTNLLIGTNDTYKSISVASFATQIVEGGLNTLDTYGLAVGDTVTFKLFIKTPTIKGGKARISLYKPDSTYTTVTGDAVEKGEEGYSEVTTTIPSGINRIYFGIQNDDTSITTSATYQYKEAIVVKGDKIGSWQPSPLDTEQKFTAINQDISSISTRVQTNADNYSSLSQTVGGIQTTVSSKADKSEITQLANTVNTKITSAQAQTLINQTTNSIVSRVETLENSTGNLVKNPELTGDLTGWNSGGGLRVMTSTLDEFAGTTVLRNETTTNTVTYSEWFDVDPSKSYEISMWVRKSAARGRWYLGVHGTDKANGTTNDLGFTQVTKAGTEAASPSTNFYFVSGGSNAKSAWVKLVGYLMPNGTSGKDMAGLGENNNNNAIMSPNLRRMRVRWLNYENGGTNTYMYVAHPKVVEVSSGSLSQISQLDNAISLRVEKNDIVNQINVSTEGILIDGKKIHITGETSIDNAAIGTAAIANLAVTNAKIGTGAITTLKVADGAITNAKIGNLAVDTANIATGAITNIKIADAAITSAKIHSLSVDKLTGMTSSFVSTLWNGMSSQVSITGSGLETLSGGQRTSLLNGSGHNFYRDNLYVGTIGTGSWVGDSSYRGLRFGLENNGNYMSWGFKSSSSASEYTTMLAWHKTSSKADKGFTFSDDVKIHSSYVLQLRRISTTGYTNGDRWLELQNYRFTTVHGVQEDGVALQRGSSGARLHLSDNRAMLIGNNASNFSVGNDSSGNFAQSYAIYSRTYSGQYNVVVTNVGTLGREVSALKYKLLVNKQHENKADQLNHSRKILDLDIKDWIDKSEAEILAEEIRQGKRLVDDNFKLNRYTGLIAEDVERVGLREHVQYGDDGEIEGFDYARAWIHLIPVTKNHEDRIKELEEKNISQQQTIDSLQFKIAQMEAKG